jgi:hypothetical protein
MAKYCIYIYIQGGPKVGLQLTLKHFIFIRNLDIYLHTLYLHNKHFTLNI